MIAQMRQSDARASARRHGPYAEYIHEETVAFVQAGRTRLAFAIDAHAHACMELPICANGPSPRSSLHFHYDEHTAHARPLIRQIDWKIALSVHNIT
ncbi:hypothetical protein [Burkholderia multivorans]|uniref:hypothetical protein n=1 Tax=Burkholderia multivorans TaxID=87883 RepID=UPI000AC718BB|nr:hypothetical protein [Burkholderia multivorans]MDN7478006.1 hypothetical protein [Burkholderia multivorans]